MPHCQQVLLDLVTSLLLKTPEVKLLSASWWFWRDTGLKLGSLMKTIKRTVVLLALTVLSSNARAAVLVTFDQAHSNMGAGLYDFTLSGAPATATLADYNSAFTITGWAAPSIGNNITIFSTAAPSAWNLTQNDSNNAKWILESTSPPNNSVDGRFEVQAKANLHGTLLWQLAWLGNNTYSSSGSVTIAAVPEPASYGFLAGGVLLALALALGRRNSGRA